MKKNITFLFLILLSIFKLSAQDGSLDNSFRCGDGIDMKGVLSCIAVQPDNKIIIAGSFGSYNGKHANSLARLNPDGSLDTTFKPGEVLGTVYYNSIISSLLVLPNGKILIGGYKRPSGTLSPFLYRYNSDGTFDGTFNSIFSAEPFNTSSVFMEIQIDGKIIVATNAILDKQFGNPYYPYGSVFRMNAKGNLDSSFNSEKDINGLVSLIKIQDDGKVIIVGSFSKKNKTDILNIARLNPDGSLDSTFNASAISENNNINTISLLSNGKIIIAGSFTQFNKINTGNVLRLNTDGTIDSSFKTDSLSNNTIYTSLIQPDGKIVLGGLITKYHGINRNNIVRLNSDGTLDNSFNMGSGFSSYTISMAMQGSYKILVAGDFSSYNGIRSMGLARLNTGLSSVEEVSTTIRRVSEALYGCIMNSSL
jgi:uncharacterized delta-60 repeat protein